MVPPPSTSGKTLMSRVEDALLPLINLVFLLLMFFIVAGQLADEPLPELPSTGASQSQQPYADLLVTASGDWQVAGETLTRETLPGRLPGAQSGQPLKVAAAGAISMAQLETLFRVLASSGYTDIILLTEPSS
ncbi:biopolymer transporter ExbD [Marinobacter salinus]|uniref:Biopolymer transporter ExbD n=2 Tax=Marinobacter salinus TaxID=1874317 RepID=A0A1D9GRN4_9GAMM|nr:biopolymer transporter ExbD [Marinobacter salinus]